MTIQSNSHPRRVLAVSTRNEPLQDSRSPLDEVPVTVLLETPTLRRCSFRPFRTIPCSARYILRLYHDLTDVGTVSPCSPNG
jgi:hypothetical protein